MAMLTGPVNYAFSGRVRPKPPPGKALKLCVIGILAVAVDVRAFALLLFRHAQPNGHISQLCNR